MLLVNGTIVSKLRRQKHIAFYGPGGGGGGGGATRSCAKILSSTTLAAIICTNQ